METLVHQCETGQTTAGTPFSRTLGTPEEAYTRIMRVSSGKGGPLDWGWVGERGCAMCLLTNVGDTPIHLSFNDYYALVIRPGESARFEPYQTGAWTVCTTGGAGLLKVVAVPK